MAVLPLRLHHLALQGQSPAGAEAPAEARPHQVHGNASSQLKERNLLLCQFATLEARTMISSCSQRLICKEGDMTLAGEEQHQEQASWEIACLMLLLL